MHTFGLQALVLPPSSVGRWANRVLRAGLSFAFLYPPINAVSNPDSWLGYFPHFVRAMSEGAGIPDLVLLHGFGFLEIIIAIWVLSGWKIFWPSCAAAILLVSIVVLDFSNFEVVFRDLSIASIAVALAIQSVSDVFPHRVEMGHGV